MAVNYQGLTDELRKILDRRIGYLPSGLLASHDPTIVDSIINRFRANPDFSFGDVGQPYQSSIE